MFKQLINELPQYLERIIYPRLEEITDADTYEMIKLKEIGNISSELGILEDIVHHFIEICESKIEQIQILMNDGQLVQVTNDTNKK